MHGCYRHYKKASGDKVDNVDGDAEQGINIYDVRGLSRTLNNVSNHHKTLNPSVEDLGRQTAGTWGYMGQFFEYEIANLAPLTCTCTTIGCPGIPKEKHLFSFFGNLLRTNH